MAVYERTMISLDQPAQDAIFDRLATRPGTPCADEYFDGIYLRLHDAIQRRCFDDTTWGNEMPYRLARRLTFQALCEAMDKSAHQMRLWVDWEAFDQRIEATVARCITEISKLPSAKIHTLHHLFDPDDFSGYQIDDPENID